MSLTRSYLLVPVLAVSSARADILNVPGDYPTIVAAVAAALTGDTSR